MNTASNLKSLTISAVKVDANGKETDLGVIAFYHKNPIVRLIWRVKKWLR